MFKGIDFMMAQATLNEGPLAILSTCQIDDENGGAKLVQGGGGIVSLRAE